MPAPKRFILNPASLQKAVGKATYERGMDVYKQQRVLESDLQGSSPYDWHVSGQVRGSNREIYDVDVDVQVDEQGNITSFEGNCTCPVSRDCKHAVAATVRAAYRSGGMLHTASSPKTAIHAATHAAIDPQERERRQANQQLTQWLDLFGEEVAPDEPLDEAAARHATQELQIVFMLSVAPHRGQEPRLLQLGWGLSRPVQGRKNASASKNAWIKVRHPGYGDDRNAPPAARQAIDLIRSLALRASSAYSYYGSGGNTGTLAGDAGHLALQHAAAHGRLFFCEHADTLGVPLQLAAPRTVGWRWQKARAAKLGEPVWRIVPQWQQADAPAVTAPDGDAEEPATSAASQCFANNPPFYVDVTTGTCGLLQCPPLSSEHLSLLLQAPPMPQSAFAAHEATLLRRLAGLPLPPVITPPQERSGIMPTAVLRMAPVAAEHVLRLGLLAATLHFDYGGVPYYSRQDDNPVLLTLPATAGERTERILLHRNATAEAAAHAALHALDLHGDVRGAFHLPFVSRAQQQQWLRWADEDFAVFRAAGFAVQTAPELAGWIARADALQVHVAPEGGAKDSPEAEGGAGGHPAHGPTAFDGAWFDLSMGMEINGERHNILPLLPDLLAQLDMAAIYQAAQAAAVYPDMAAAQNPAAALTGPLLQPAAVLTGPLLQPAPAATAALPPYVYLPRQDGSYLRLPTAPLAPWLLALIELFEGGHSAQGGSLRLSRTQLLRVGASLGEGVAWAGAAQLRDMVAQLRGSSALPQVPPPAGLQATLRPYQQHGLNWLQFLRTHHLGGLLADDMGLGKTLQTLAHLLVEKEAGRLQHPALVIAPVSLMGNWQREAARFAPTLKTLVWHGTDRHSKASQIGKTDVIFTSYALLHRDRERWLAQPFSVVVLDEAQNIKNAATHAAQTVGGLHARQRLALSGTPLENHLGELWSLFHFLMPGFLGSHKQFTQWFRTPIEKHGDTDRLAQLRRRVTPFMLRRAKSEVAADLPPKQEIITAVTLGEQQANLYETIRMATEETVRNALAGKGLARSHIEILDALLKLRQVCCDPRLVPLDAARKVKQSAKLELLMDLLPELLAEGRRVLLFSQFTSMLALIEDELKAARLRWAKLTGQTQKRDEVIRRFTSGEVPLFLISLKAGGVGLNLTQADTVIHYDPWWNPAVENQATDRAHRIGQDKAVMVYKLVAQGTIEERILALQERKAALAEGMYSDAAARKQPLFTEDDLSELLRPVGDAMAAKKA